jgi:hypothetical protein
MFLFSSALQTATEASVEDAEENATGIEGM